MVEENMNEFTYTEIGIGSIIAKSFYIYKSRFKSLIFLSMISFAVNLVNNVISYFNSSLFTPKDIIYSVLHQNLLLDISVFFIGFIITILNSYFIIRVDICLNMLSFKAYKGETCNARQAFEETAGLFWRYVGVNFLYGLIMAIPIGGILLTYKYMGNVFLKYLIISFLMIPTVYLGIKFCFASTSAIINKESHNFFRTSSALVKGNFIIILIVFALIYTFTYLPYFLLTHFFINMGKVSLLLRLLAIPSINYLYLMFTAPFGVIINVLMYCILREYNEIGLPDCETNLTDSDGLQ